MKGGDEGGLKMNERKIPKGQLESTHHPHEGELVEHLMI